MPPPSRLVAPTIVEAVRELSGDRDRGFVFVGSDGSERLCTFHDIALEAERRAGALAACGLKKGDRLALVIPDGDEFVLSFLAALFAGVVPVPIYPQLSFKNLESYHDTVSHIARASGAKMLLTTESAKPYVDPVSARVDGLRMILTVDDLAGEHGKATRRRVSGRSRVPSVHQREHLAPEGRDGDPRQPGRQCRSVHDPRPGTRP